MYPLSLPFSEKSPVTRKARATRKNTEEKLAILSSQINTMSTQLSTGLKEVVQAIKSTPTILSGVNWTPLLQGLANVVVTSIGGSTQFPTAPITAVQAPDF